MSKSSDKQFTIPFVGLKIGTHEFEFEITDSFFEKIEYSIVKKGKVQVKLSFEKKESMMIGNYSIKGSVTTACDRCTEPVGVEIENDYRLVYKFDSAATDDESLVIIYPEEFELDVKENILELINVSIPPRRIHKEGECNEDMLDLFDEYVVNASDDEVDEFDEDDEDYEPEEVTEEEAFEEEEEMNAEDEEDLGEIDPRWNALKNLKNDSPR